jgi:hypothetical protein
MTKTKRRLERRVVRVVVVVMVQPLQIVSFQPTGATVAWTVLYDGKYFESSSSSKQVSNRWLCLYLSVVQCML